MGEFPCRWQLRPKDEKLLLSYHVMDGLYS